MQKVTLEGELENEFPNNTIEITDSVDKKEWVITIDGVTENVPIGKDTPTALKVAEHKNEKFSTNTELEDSLGNKITVPAGFKIVEGNNVTDGIVIEDVDAGTTATKGSQFVWIPVGEIYSDTNGTITNIELCRCGFNGYGEKVTVEEGWEYQLTIMTESGIPSFVVNPMRSFTFSEEITSRIGSTADNTNATAKNLGDFLSKASKGYYIGRYEARTPMQRIETTEDENLTQITEKSGDYVYNYVTQSQASSLSRNMYTSDNFNSDLMNSYAWDTAILFLQAFDDRTNKIPKYSMQKSLDTSLAQIGTTADKICNIYDMAGNCCEWTTESISDTSNCCVTHGSDFQSNYHYSSSRDTCNTTMSGENISFRTILYVK